MDFQNATELDSDRLEALFERHSQPYQHARLTVRVRFSRGADFSGTCYYQNARIFINLGRHLKFPYTLGTHIAKARSTHSGWRRDVYRLTVDDGYQLALFIYLHELFHYLVKAAGRSPRRKEAMCDRFAARVLVDHFGCPITTARGAVVPRERWDFQDLHAFVAKAPRQRRPARAARREIPVRILGDGA